MRTFLSVLLLLLLSACSPVTGDSGFGSRLVPAACIAEAAPWILGDAVKPSAWPQAALDAAPVLRAVTYNLHSVTCIADLAPSAHSFSRVRKSSVT